MKVAIIGSRNSEIKIEKYLPENISLIISGGARGIYALAEKYADKNGIPKLIFLPDYEKYGRNAPLERNKLIAANADIVIAFWDGVSKGTKFTIDYARKIGKPVKAVYAGGGLLPGNFGRDCACNGEHYVCGDLVACFCADCDYLRCCDNANYPLICKSCLNERCERKQLI